jgi:hypothetical protein
MFSQSQVRMNKTLFAISIFLILFTTVHTLKPAFAYGPDGEFRQFGVGYKNKTVLPVWTISIALAIFSYLMVLCYLR